jgi:hypothetical protein
VTKLGVSLNTTVSNANQEYEKQTNPETEVPSAPVYAARLNGLLRTLASAENAVAERVKARETLVTGLEKLLEANRKELEKDQASRSELAGRKTEIGTRNNKWSSRSCVLLGQRKAMVPQVRRDLLARGRSLTGLRWKHSRHQRWRL